TVAVHKQYRSYLLDDLCTRFNVASGSITETCQRVWRGGMARKLTLDLAGRHFYLQMSSEYSTLRHVSLTFACSAKDSLMASQTKKSPMNFATMAYLDVPQGRNGKHKQVVTKILSDLDQLPQGGALKVPLA